MFRELDQRTADRMTVTLEWDPATGNVRVRCQGDRFPDETFCYSVDPGEAALAFKHPFAMRPASIDRVRSDKSRDQVPRGGQGRWGRWLRGRAEARNSRTHGDYSLPWWLI
jgi:hypothetical protein